VTPRCEKPGQAKRRSGHFGSLLFWPGRRTRTRFVGVRQPRRGAGRWRSRRRSGRLCRGLRLWVRGDDGRPMLDRDRGALILAADCRRRLAYFADTGRGRELQEIRHRLTTSLKAWVGVLFWSLELWRFSVWSSSAPISAEVLRGSFNAGARLKTFAGASLSVDDRILAYRSRAEKIFWD
jgi:hypothetical protein